MTEGLWAAIIGVGGTIFGTLLGFLLGKIDFGKLKIQVKKVKSTPVYDHCELCDYGEKWIIGLYNSSNKNKVFRCAKVILQDLKKTVLLTIPLKDLATTRCASYGVFTEDVGTINVQPNCGIDVDVKFAIVDIETAFKAKKVFLQYQNEKFKCKTIELWDCDYMKIAKLSKESNNG